MDNKPIRANDTKDWERGYFCAIAMYLKERGTVDAIGRDLYHAGGDPSNADREDLDVFIECGLYTANPPLSGD